MGTSAKMEPRANSIKFQIGTVLHMWITRLLVIPLMTFHPRLGLRSLASQIHPHPQQQRRIWIRDSTYQHRWIMTIWRRCRFLVAICGFNRPRTQKRFFNLSEATTGGQRWSNTEEDMSREEARRSSINAHTQPNPIPILLWWFNKYELKTFPPVQMLNTVWNPTRLDVNEKREENDDQDPWWTLASNQCQCSLNVARRMFLVTAQPGHNML